MRVYNLALSVQDCGGSLTSSCVAVANPSQYNQSKPYSIQGGKCSVNRATLLVGESYDYQYVNGSGPVTVTTTWVVQSGSAQPSTSSFQLTPPSGSYPGQQPSRPAQVTPTYPTGAVGTATTGSVTYSEAWQDSRQGTQTSLLGYSFNWTCQ